MNQTSECSCPPSATKGRKRRIPLSMLSLLLCFNFKLKLPLSGAHMSQQQQQQQCVCGLTCHYTPPARSPAYKQPAVKPNPAPSLPALTICSPLPGLGPLGALKECGAEDYNSHERGRGGNSGTANHGTPRSSYSVLEITAVRLKI